MLLDFEIRSCSRKCTASERDLEPGEVYFSVLLSAGAELLRHDYSAESWQGPPEECLGWWRSKIPVKDGGVPKLAPTEVMLNLFATLAERPEDEGFRYLLGLLLLRRRVLRREDSYQDDDGRERLLLFCPRRDERSELVVCEPDAEQAEQLQQRMIDLLYGGAEVSLPKEESTST